MSIIHIKQIEKKINTLFEKELDLNDIGENDPQRSVKVLSRCLAAYAIFNKIECTAQEAASAVVDGGDDNGIDAIYYSPIARKMLIVQSKWSVDGHGEPDSAAVSKFCKGIKDLFNLDFDRFNSKVYSKKTIIENAINEYDTKYEIILIDTCLVKSLAKHAMQFIEDLLKELNNAGDETAEQVVNFVRINQGKVHSTLALSAGDDPIDLELGLTQWGAVNEPYKAYFGMVSGNEVAEWWKNYNTRLFTKNIRQVLGLTDVNEEIEKTLKENPELFWYFNNGITIIADKIEKSAVGGGNKDFGSFKLTKIAIVNGAQTVSTIGKFAEAKTENNRVDIVKVGVRMIQLSETPENFDKSVTKTNNRQNRIENRDFVSQDEEQIRIKKELAIDGIDYNIMRSENFILTEKSFELSEATAALACTSGKTALAVQAKGGIGKFYENLEKGIYKEIFNSSVSGYYVYNSVKVVREIDKILAKEIDKLQKHSGRRYGLLVHGNRIIALLTIKELYLKPKLGGITFEPLTEEIYNKCIKVIDGVWNYLETNYPDSVLGTLFKNTTKCTDITTNTIIEI